MPLTAVSYVNGFNPAEPDGSTDPISEGDDRFRQLYRVLVDTFPNIGGRVNASHTDLNQLAGVTLSDVYVARTSFPGPYMASEAEARAGTDNTKLMTPLRTQQQITERFGSAQLKLPTAAGSGAYPSPAVQGGLLWDTVLNAVVGWTGSQWVEFQRRNIDFEAEAPIADVTGSQIISVNHGLGVVPRRTDVFFRNLVADLGYAPGTLVNVESARTSDGSVCALVAVNASAVRLLLKSKPRLFELSNPATDGTITVSSWRVLVRCWR